MSKSEVTTIQVMVEKNGESKVDLYNETFKIGTINFTDVNNLSKLLKLITSEKGITWDSDEECMVFPMKKLM